MCGVQICETRNVCLCSRSGLINMSWRPITAKVFVKASRTELDGQPLNGLVIAAHQFWAYLFSHMSSCAFCPQQIFLKFKSHWQLITMLRGFKISGHMVIKASVWSTTLVIADTASGGTTCCWTACMRSLRWWCKQRWHCESLTQYNQTTWKWWAGWANHDALYSCFLIPASGNTLLWTEVTWWRPAWAYVPWVHHELLWLNQLSSKIWLCKVLKSARKCLILKAWNLCIALLKMKWWRTSFRKQSKVVSHKAWIGSALYVQVHMWRRWQADIIELFIEEGESDWLVGL